MNIRITNAGKHVSRAATLAEMIDDQTMKLYPLSSQLATVENIQNLLAMLSDELKRTQAAIADLEMDSRIVDVFRAATEYKQNQK